MHSCGLDWREEADPLFPLEKCLAGLHGSSSEREFGSYAAQAGAPAVSLPYDLSFSTIDLGLAHSRAKAPKLWENLRRHSPERRRALIRDTRKFRNWGLSELLCLESARAATSDPVVAVELAELAVQISNVLEEWQPAEEYWLFELRAYAWAHLGNARRVAGNLLAAEQAFSHADSWWRRGERKVGDALGYEARMLALKASLRREQRRFQEAHALLDQALGAAPSGDLIAILTINKANVFEEAGDLERATALLAAKAPAVEAIGDPRLLLCLRHNLLDTLAKAGRYGEAYALLPQVEPLAQEIGGDLDRVRLRWVKARIIGGLGDTDRAVYLLKTVRQELANRAIVFDAALVSLDLAAILLSAGRAAEVKELAGDMLAIFEAQEIHREALVALGFFRQAAEAETLTLELMRHLAAYFRDARRNPTLPFQEPSPSSSGETADEEETAH